MSWRKDVADDHDYREEIKQIVADTMDRHELEDEKLQGVLTDLFEEMTRMTLKIIDESKETRDYIDKRWH